MLGKVLLDPMLVKKRGSGLPGKPVLILVAFQAECHKEKYVGVSLTHDAKIHIILE